MKQVLVCALLLGAAPVQAEIELVGVFHWQIDRDYFGGLSGIELSPDGMTYTVISDSGFIGTGDVIREGDQITGMRHDPFYLLPEPLLWPRSGEENRDSEGLAVTEDGTVYVSYEGIAVVREERGEDASPIVLPAPSDFRRMHNNGSLEALAVDADGRLYVIPERSGRAMRPFPVFRYDGAEWEIAFSIPRTELFVPTGADIGPDGRLYLLERDFNGIGFATRIRRFELDGSGETTLLETRHRTHDNLEGLSVWADDDGLRLTMVSDNNFRWFQRTEIVEYRLTE